MGGSVGCEIVVVVIVVGAKFCLMSGEVGECFQNYCVLGSMIGLFAMAGNMIQSLIG